MLLSAAFDNVDQNVLLDRMFKQFSIQDTSLSWMRSYLSGRSQALQIDGCVSKIIWLLLGVPRESVLSPLMFSIHSERIRDITRKHGFNIHIYADDT